jgi:hypothetical protein
MTDELELELEPDPGWYAVPEDPDGLDDWAHGLVRELAGPEAAGEAVKGGAEVVRLHAELAHEQLVELAFVFLPEPLAPVLAACHVELVPGTAGDLPDLDDLERVLAEQQLEHVGVPAVSRTLLSAGPAVRQQVLAADEDGDVVERVTHVVASPLLDDALLRITTSWRAVALGDALTEQADRMAAALLVRAG